MMFAPTMFAVVLQLVLQLVSILSQIQRPRDPLRATSNAIEAFILADI